MTWIAVAAGAALGFVVAWAVGGGFEALGGVILGALLGRVLVALRYGW